MMVPDAQIISPFGDKTWNDGWTEFEPSPLN